MFSYPGVISSSCSVADFLSKSCEPPGCPGKEGPRLYLETVLVAVPALLLFSSVMVGKLITLIMPEPILFRAGMLNF